MTATDLEFERIDYSVKETGAAIRAALRDAFPGVKFSLRMSRGTGHGWFNLDWTDGPTARQVDAVTHTFRSSYFDGMDDSTRHIPATMAVEADGVIRERRYSCHGVNTQRTISDAAGAWALAFGDMVGRDVIEPRYANVLDGDIVHRVLSCVDLTGIDWDALPAPTPEFSGRRVAWPHVADIGRDYYPTTDAKHRA